MKKLNPILRYSLIIALSVISVLLIFGPDLGTWYINKYSKDLLGRNIKIANIDFNIFSGKMHIENFNMYEQKSDSTFISFEELNLNMNVFQLLRKHLFIEELTLIQPDINVKYQNEHFNFSDLLNNGNKSSNTEDNASEPLFSKYTVDNFTIKYGTLDYKNFNSNAEHNINNFSLKLPHMSIGEKSTSDVDLEFDLTQGGKVKTRFSIDNESKEYKWNLIIENFNLNPTKSYIDSLMGINHIEGLLSGNFNIKGDIDTIESPLIKGKVAVKDLAMVDRENFKFLFLKSLDLKTGYMDLTKEYFPVDSIEVDSLNLHFENYRESSSIDRLFASNKPKTDSIYADTSINSENKLSWRIDKFNLKNSNLYISDLSNSTGEFNYAFNNITIDGNNLIPGSNSHILINSKTSDGGSIKAEIDTDPGDILNGNYNIYLSNIDAKSFNPYSLQYLAYPIESGKIYITSNNSIKNKTINSRYVIDARNTHLGNKRDDIEPNIKNLPVKTAMAVLRDKQDVINIDFGLKGDLSDPDFKYGKAISKLLLNMLTKVATSPINAIADGLNTKDEEQAKSKLN